MKFENNDIQMIEINGKWYFELYSVGMALGQVKTAKGKNYPAKDRIDKNAESAEIKPVVRNAQPYITEEQIYDLMLETRTDKCRTFRKWLTNEVLPELNHTGTYTMSTNRTDSTETNDSRVKYISGVKLYGATFYEPKELEKSIGVKSNTIYHYAVRNLEQGVDYITISGQMLADYKKVKVTNHLISSLFLLTESGRKKIFERYCNDSLVCCTNVKDETTETRNIVITISL